MKFTFIVLLFYFLNTSATLAQMDSLLNISFGELYKTAIELEQKKDTAYINYYKALLATEELPDCEAHFALANYAINRKAYEVALYHLQSIIEDTISKYDLHTARGRYKYYALQRSENLLLFLCRYPALFSCTKFIEYFEQNQRILDESIPTTPTKTKPSAALSAGMQTDFTSESLAYLFGTIVRYPNREIDITQLSPPTSNVKFKLDGNDTMYYVRLDELLLERLKERYTIAQIDSALDAAIVIHIDTAQTNVLKMQTNQSLWKYSYSVAYYTFCSARIDIPFTKLDASEKEIYQALRETPKQIHNTICNTSFYKKVKAILPRENISNIPCFTLPNQ